MSPMNPGGGAAGWHRDPYRRHEYRWFDGQRWTDDVASRGVTSTDRTGLATTSPESAPVATQQQQQQPPRRRVSVVTTAIIAVLATGLGAGVTAGIMSDSADESDGSSSGVGAPVGDRIVDEFDDPFDPSAPLSDADAAATARVAWDLAAPIEREQACRLYEMSPELTRENYLWGAGGRDELWPPMEEILRTEC